MTNEEADVRWRAITDSGKADATVHEIEQEFSALRNRLRARYAISSPALASLELAEFYVTNDAKKRLVARWAGGGR